MRCSATSYQDAVGEDFQFPFIAQHSTRTAPHNADPSRYLVKVTAGQREPA